MKTADIITDADAQRVHGHANFGDMTPREVVDDTILKYAFGFDTGHTAMTIALEHKLASKPRTRYGPPRLTKKGYQYLRALIGPHFKTIKKLARESA